MKSEIKPGILIGIVAAVLLVIVAFYVVAGGGGSSEKLDLKKIDPKILRDENPPRRGQPGYRERTTDPPSN